MLRLPARCYFFTGGMGLGGTALGGIASGAGLTTVCEGAGFVVVSASKRMIPLLAQQLLDCLETACPVATSGPQA